MHLIQEPISYKDGQGIYKGHHVFIDVSIVIAISLKSKLKLSFLFVDWLSLKASLWWWIYEHIYSIYNIYLELFFLILYIDMDIHFTHSYDPF